MALFSAGACGQPAGEPAAAGSAPGGAASVDSKAGAAAPQAANRLMLPVLGAHERRATLFVIPGDALVEVDGQPTRRRDGVIDLVGKVGDERRVRAWKGSKSTAEKVVTIHESGASPSLLDLNEATAPRPAPGASTRNPVIVDLD